MGAKIQCTSCYTAYHPLCARLAGLHMEILDGGDSGEDIPVSHPLTPLHPMSNQAGQVQAALYFDLHVGLVESAAQVRIEGGVSYYPSALRMAGC